MNGPTEQQRRELLAELQQIEKVVRADLLKQYRSDPKLMARALRRLAEEENSPDDESWLQTFTGRAAVLYILKTLYVRVLEDQGLLTYARIRAGGSYELFQRLFPNLGVAAYLRRVFDEAARFLPELFAPTPLEIASPSEESARGLWKVWQAAAAGGGPRFDFRGHLDTRFIGDLYQDLDPEVKKRYALLQTPRFIEEFILDRTLEPALQKFGLEDFRIIDPTCGSGHFLLGAFERLIRAWLPRLSDTSEIRWEAALRALSSVYGADINEYACALSRFRLLLAVVRETGVTELDRLGNLHFNVVACDSLIPWERLAEQPLPGMADYSWLGRYGGDSERARNEEFFARPFQAVVGNPPYIMVADKKKRDDYRRAWPRSARGKYSLSAPMTERFMLMPVSEGYCGIIVANNFCKRSFGRGLIERVFPDVELTLIVDTSGTYIPGHGTPTVMLFASRAKVDARIHYVQVVAAKEGEPQQPKDPASAVVWTSIKEHWPEQGYEDRWIAVQRSVQATFCTHPWSLGSDAVMHMKAALDGFPRVKDYGGEAGFAVIIGEDDAFIRRYTQALPLRPVVIGKDVRNWQIVSSGLCVATPERSRYSDAELEKAATTDLWALRTTLWARPTFGGASYRERPGEKVWWQFHQVAAGRLGAGRLRIVIGEAAANNHFVIDESDAIFVDTAPVLTLQGANAADYRNVTGVLNSSTLEFWVKQVCFPKGGDKVGEGRTPGEPWEQRYVHNATNVVQAPIPPRGAPERQALVERIEAQMTLRLALAPENIIEQATAAHLLSNLAEACARSSVALEMVVSLQEELDWQSYLDFGLVDDSPLLSPAVLQPLAPGHRPFEIALARRVARGDEETEWFQRHGLVPTTEISSRYTGEMRSALERRLSLIESNGTLALLEQPVYKRRWQIESWEARVKAAAEAWLLERVEVELRRLRDMLTLDELVDWLGDDSKVIAVGALAKRDKEVSLADTLGRLLANESVSDNPARLFTRAGLLKYLGNQTAYLGKSRSVPNARPFEPGEPVDWKRVWRLQEREDAGQTVTVAAPYPFKNTDYAHPNGWKLRGKFNVPNERFIAYDDVHPVRYAWGGWTTHVRASLSLKAFELRGREPDNAPEQPSEDAPQRCGIQFALWDNIDELRRTGDPLHEEVQTIAQLCNRSCPCDVLEAWRSLGSGRRNGQSRGRLRRGIEQAAERHEMRGEIDPDMVEGLLERLGVSGHAGATLAELEPIFLGNREAARRTLEALRTDGQVEVTGKGRRTRYRLPHLPLF